MSHRFRLHLYPGPVLNRFDRFLLIGPRAKWGPHSVHLPKQTYTFYRSCLCVVPARGSVFVKLFWETKIVLTFSQRSLKTQYKFALLPPSKYTKSLLCNHLGIQMKQLRSLKMSLWSARSLKKTLGEADSILEAWDPLPTNIQVYCSVFITLIIILS